MVKKPSIQKAILRTLSNKKAVSIDSVQEYVQKSILHDIKPLESKNGLTEKATYAINRSIKNLVLDGLIESFNSDKKQYFRLTDSGKHKFNNIALECESSLVSTKWDGFWRIILLDLPEERKNEREALRYLLKKAGFVCIKNSVWISMYPYENLFINIKKDLKLSSEMMIIATDNIDSESEKEFFSLCNLNNKND